MDADRARGGSIAAGSRRSRPISLAAGLASLIAALPASAAIWESNDWALTGTLGAAIGYESNVFGIADAEGDTVFLGEPSLSFSRKGSATLLRFDVGLETRNYFDLSDENTVDPSFAIKFAYPQAEESLTSHEANVTWERRSYPDLSVGDRLRTTAFGADWFGVLRDTGKTQIVGNAGVATQDYSRFGSDTIGYTGGLGLAWSPRDLFQYSASYDFSLDEYSSRTSPTDDSKRTGHGANFAVRGEIMVNLVGSASVGVRNNKFTGAFASDGWDWFAAGDLSYTQTERRSFNLQASRTTSYDAIGQAYNNTNFTVSVRQNMAGGFSGRVSAGLGSYSYVEESANRGDDFVRFGAGLDYDLTGRFTAALNFEWYGKDSNVAFYDFNGYDIYARCSWRF